MSVVVVVTWFPRKKKIGGEHSYLGFLSSCFRSRYYKKKGAAGASRSSSRTSLGVPTHRCTEGSFEEGEEEEQVAAW